MKILVDTDVLIDVALDLAPHAESAVKLLDALEQRKGKGYVAWHSLANFYYLVAPAKGSSPAREFIADLMVFIDLAPSMKEGVQYACQSSIKDFEDALQVAAAMASGVTVIATRNIKDYVNSPIRAALPSSVCKELQKG